ncbi:hypothetical protein D3C80_1491780 [compost metagenome]
MRQAHLLQYPADPLLHLAWGQPPVLQAEGYVLVRGRAYVLGLRILEYKLNMLLDRGAVLWRTKVKSGCG